MQPAGPSSPTELSVAVVLHHSDLARFEATLTCLGAACRELPGPVRLWVVDQSCHAGYSDRARDVARRATAGTRLHLEFIASDHNAGYGGGHNWILGQPVSRFHLVLNPDVELAESALHEGLAVLRDNPDIVAVAPRSIDDSGAEEYLAKRYPSVLVLLLRAFAPKGLRRCFAARLHAYELRDLPSTGGPQDVPLLSGCCMLLRGPVFHEVGGFDERYFLYFEDYDLSLRLARLGRVVRVPEMEIHHHGGNAAGKGWRHIGWFSRGAWRFFSTWGWRFT